MKKYKIKSKDGTTIIANNIVDGIATANDIDALNRLIADEEAAIAAYDLAISQTQSDECAKLYDHIKGEEVEHLEELTKLKKRIELGANQSHIIDSVYDEFSFSEVIYDSINDAPVEAKEVDTTNYVVGKQGVWFARAKGEKSMLSRAFCSADKGKTWHTCNLETKTEAPSGKTQAGKYFFRTSSSKTYTGPRVAMGRNVLTWYAANGIHEVDPSQQIDHVDGNYRNDNLSNLERVSGAENLRRMKAMLQQRSSVDSIKDAAKTITVQCYVLSRDKQNILTQLRGGPAWPGLAVPGGHVKADEKPIDAAVREVLEETGLHIRQLELFGTHEYHCEEDGDCIAMLYKTSDYYGDLHDCDEGSNAWMPIEAALAAPNCATDFQYLLSKCVNGTPVNDSTNVEDNYYGTLPKERRYRYRSYIIVDYGYSSAPYSIEGISYANEFRSLEEAKKYIRENLSDSIKDGQVAEKAENPDFSTRNEIYNLIQKYSAKYGVKIVNLAQKNRTFTAHHLALRVDPSANISEKDRKRIDAELSKEDELY